MYIDIYTYIPKVGLIPPEVGLKTLRNTLENRNYEEIPTENHIKMEEFVLKD